MRKFLGVLALVLLAASACQAAPAGERISFVLETSVPLTTDESKRIFSIDDIKHIFEITPPVWDNPPKVTWFGYVPDEDAIAVEVKNGDTVVLDVPRCQNPTLPPASCIVPELLYVNYRRVPNKDIIAGDLTTQYTYSLKSQWKEGSVVDVLFGTLQIDGYEAVWYLYGRSFR